MKLYPCKLNSILFIVPVISILILTGCSASRRSRTIEAPKSGEIKSTVKIKNKVAPRIINTKNISREELVDFAETLIGVKYRYGSMVKENGFDCSGFINYVFNHFNIPVPRVSSDFTNAGKEVPIKDSKRGDLILFTGSNANSGVVGHMGIVTKNKNGQLEFIHASESKGVMISGMNAYFVLRFVKVNRIFAVF